MPNANPSSAIALAEGVGGSYSAPWRARAARLYPRAAAVARVAPSDPAIRVATDFARDEPRTITRDRRIEDALREMECSNVGALLVAQDALVIGLITSYDIEGRRPLEFLRNSLCLARREIEVQHMMTPWDRLSTLEWTAVCTATASHIERYFRNTRASHVMLVEQLEYLGPCVRGLISRRRVEREMGRAL